eukprot:900669_1
MSFLAIHETKSLDYIDIEFIEAMQCIKLADYSFKPIKELPPSVIDALPPRIWTKNKDSPISAGLFDKRRGASNIFRFKMTSDNENEENDMPVIGEDESYLEKRKRLNLGSNSSDEEI